MNNDDLINFECPEGMYPFDVDYQNMLDSFDELKESSDAISDCLNLPVSYFFDNERNIFSLVFYMPRKYKTFSFDISNPNKVEVLEWLNPWLKEQYKTWFGWKES